jgi:flagellar hook-basal body complex protein FliE
MAIEGIAGAAGIGPAAIEAMRARVDSLVPSGGAVGGESAASPHALLGGSGKAPDFGEVLSQAIGSVTALQDASKTKQMELITGKDVAVHDVMATAAEAGIAVQLTTAVTSKALAAYQEIWRMEI